MVQVLGLSTSTIGARVQSLVSQVRSHKPHDMAKKKVGEGFKMKRGHTWGKKLGEPL